MMAGSLGASGRIARLPAYARDTQRVSLFSLAARRLSLRHAALGRETVTAVPLFAGSRFMPSRAAAAGVNSACSVGYIPAARSGGRSPTGRSHPRPFFGIPNLLTCRGANASVFSQSRKQSLHDRFKRFERHVVTHQLRAPCPRNWTRSFPRCRKFAAITHRLLGEKRP